MSLKDELQPILDLEEVNCLYLTKDADLHGQDAIEVEVLFHDGRTVTGTFTTERKDSFGGVKFSQDKNVPALMYAKVRSVLDGKSEL